MNTMTLPEINEQLTQEIERTIEKITPYADETFFAPFGDKWSMALQLMHLTRSVKPLNQALSAPKLLLRTQFGRPKRPSMSYDAVVNKYKKANVPTKTGFEPTLPENPSKEIIVNSFKKHHETLLKLIGTKWEEDKIDSYQVPHPLLGKMTIREILCFMIHHLRHHQEAIDRIIASRAA